MEMMYAWFPIAKGIVIFVMLATIVFLVRKRWYKASFVFGAVMIALAIYSPVKIDGTNTKAHHKVTHAERTAEYIDVAEEAVVVTTKKETFQERMAKEDARSKEKNKDIMYEIKSIQEAINEASSVHSN